MRSTGRSRTVCASRTLDIPPAILSERALRKHVQGLLDKNSSSVDFMNFCGAGCWQHHVPSVVDEIINRAEFLSAYCGGDYSDLGKYLTRYEFNSMLGELLDYDAVANPIYDWGDVAGRSFRMARRITGRDKVLVPAHMSPMRLMEARTLCQPESMANSTKIRFYEWDRETGMVDLEDLRAKLDDSYAAVYWESPGYLGTIEANGPDVKLADACQDLPSTASTHGHSAGPRRPARSAPTSPAATSSRSACTCTPAVATPGSSPSRTTTRSSPRSARSSSTRSWRPPLPASTPWLRPWPSAPATGCATRARTGWARRPACGPSRPRCTWRSWVRRASGRSARPASPARTMRPRDSVSCRAWILRQCAVCHRA